MDEKAKTLYKEIASGNFSGAHKVLEGMLEEKSCDRIKSVLKSTEEAK